MSARPAAANLRPPLAASDVIPGYDGTARGRRAGARSGAAASGGRRSPRLAVTSAASAAAAPGGPHSTGPFQIPGTNSARRRVVGGGRKKRAPPTRVTAHPLRLAAACHVVRDFAPPGVIYSRLSYGGTDARHGRFACR